MTGEKYVVRVGVPSLHVLLQAKPERASLLPGALARACVSSLRSDGKVATGSEASALAALISATNATEAVLLAAPRAHPALDSMTSAEMSG